MMTNQEAMKLALEALKGVYQYGSDTLSGPVKGQPDDRKWQRDGVLEMTNRAYKGIKDLEKALAKQEQGESVAWVNVTDEGKWYVQYILPKELMPEGTKFYTTPPQRKPLTDEQIEACLHHVDENGIGLFAFARAIEAAHGIKE